MKITIEMELEAQETAMYLRALAETLTPGKAVTVSKVEVPLAAGPVVEVEPPMSDVGMAGKPLLDRGTVICPELPKTGLRVGILEDGGLTFTSVKKEEPPINVAGKADAVPLDVYSPHLNEAFATDADFQRGADALNALVYQWALGWGQENGPEVDRAGLLMGLATNHLGPVRSYVREKGGLATAVADALFRMGYHKEVWKLAKDIAYRMVQVGSALGFRDFEKLLEKSLVATRDLPDDTPIKPGLSGDLIIDDPEERPALIGGRNGTI